MGLRDRAVMALAVTLALALLLAPALWNGFPLLQWDSGGYLARTFEPILVPSRPVAYGLLLRAGVPYAFWPVLLVQAGLTLWVLNLLLRALGYSRRPLLLLGLVAALSLLTTLPFLTAILLTDIFCGLAVIALYLLALRAETLTRGERIGLVLLIAFAASTHSATFAVLAAVLLGLAALRLTDRRFRPRLRAGLVSLALGAGIVLSTNYAVVQRLTWTPGGVALTFGRMLQDGIVTQYLDARCPAAGLKLCAVKDIMPRDADTWFWGSDVFDRLGRFAGLNDEMERVAIGALKDYPALQFEMALRATARQLIAVHTGEGVLDTVWHSYRIVERYTPALAAPMHAARQQRGEMSFARLNALHYPLALAALALLPVTLWRARRGRASRALGEFALVGLLAVAANAVVCGALSNPHDRYGARIVWVASLAAALAVTEAAARRSRSGTTALNDPAALALTVPAGRT